MKNWIYIIISGICLILLIVLYINSASFDVPENRFLEKIKELELKIDSLKSQKDSIRTIIDSTHVKIITNEKHFQERVNTIITQPDSVSESFTRQYLRDYASARGYCIIGTSETK